MSVDGPCGGFQCLRCAALPAPPHGTSGVEEAACPLTQTAIHALRSLHAREDDGAAVAVLGAVDCGATFDTVLQGLSPQAKRTLYTAAVDHVYNTLLGAEEVSRARTIVQRLKSLT